MGREQVDELSRGEATVLHTGKDGVDVALREGDGAIVGREGCVRATSQELELRCTRAVGTKISVDELLQPDVSKDCSTYMPTAPAN